MDQKSFWTLNLVRYAKIGDADGIRKALEEGADIHYQGDSALQWACNYGKFDAAKCLLENGADPKITNIVGFTAVELAEVSLWLVTIATTIAATAMGAYLWKVYPGIGRRMHEPDEPAA